MSILPFNLIGLVMMQKLVLWIRGKAGSFIWVTNGSICLEQVFFVDTFDGLLFFRKHPGMFIREKGIGGSRSAHRAHNGQYEG